MEGTNGRTPEEVGRKEGTGKGTSSGETRGGSSTPRKATAGGTATGRNTTGTAQKGKQTEKGVEISDVKTTGKPAPQPVAVNVPEVSEKPKRKRAAKAPKKKEGVSADMVSDFIVGVSQVAGSKPETMHWQIDKKEAQQIAEPLCNIIEKNENLKKVAEHSDSIALVMACVMVFAPRMYITMSMAKEKKSMQKHKVIKEVKQHDPETGASERNSKQDNGRNANAGTNVSTSLSELLSVQI